MITRRALALDLDGTLLDRDDTVSRRNRAAVAAAADAGWHVILATARWYQLAERTARELGLVDPVIACSGAEVRRLRDGVDLFDVRLPEGFVAELYSLCDATEGVVLACQEHDVALRGPLEPTMPEMHRVASLIEAAESTARCVLVFGDELTLLIVATLRQRWGTDVRFLNSMTARGHRVLTLTSARADKGLALAVACRDLGIEPSDVVAMGDSETDIEMFKVAGASVAMGQSDDTVRAAATWITSSHDEHGVARAIERIMRGEAPGPGVDDR
jgi:hypothetical protein